MAAGKFAELGNVLRSLRNRRQLSLEAVAGRIGISLSALAMYERGERMPPLPRLQQLADFYGVGLETLLGRSAGAGSAGAGGGAGSADTGAGTRAAGAAGATAVSERRSGFGHGAHEPLEPRLENLPRFLRATGEVSEDLIRQIMALIRVRSGGH